MEMDDVKFKELKVSPSHGANMIRGGRWGRCNFKLGRMFSCRELHILGTLLYKFTSKDATLLSPIGKGWLLVHVGN